MSYKIGFSAEINEEKQAEAFIASKSETMPRKSVVQVHFSARNMTLAYYNDRFDLHRGDIVFVDGKLEGLRGRVVDVNYNFKIKLSDYKRVIAVADTSVHGRFSMAGSHFVTFDSSVLPASKAITWFKAPTKEEDEFESGNDDTSFCLDNLGEMKISGAVADRGNEYYMQNKVKYLCIDGIRGYAIVEGREAYEVEFEYSCGEIKSLTCSCFCSGNCKHEFAAMLQLRETLEIIEKNYKDEYERSGYFAAVDKNTLIAFAVGSKETGNFTL